jgi:hypothetical protein
MTTDTTAAVGRGQSEEALDRAFDVLAHAYRRTVVEELEREAPLELEALAERVAERDGSISVESAKLELAHRHLPRLDDAGVVAYDASDRLCDLDQATTVRSVMNAIDRNV